MRSHDDLTPFLLLFLLFLFLLLSACAPPPTNDHPTIPERITVTGYSRDNFGSGWGRDGACSVREAVLIDWFGPGDGPCVAADAQIPDPYTGDPLSVSHTDIDHIYPLAAAWDFGAWEWDLEQRMAFANDPVNLVPVDSGVNRAKSDLTPHEWLPYKRCDYAERYLTVAGKYQLAVSDGDLKALHGACRGFG